MKRLALLALAAAAWAPAAAAAPGDPGTPDRGFGKRGVATISHPFLELVPDVLEVRGRRIVVGARAHVPRGSAGPGYSFFRLLPDGRVDRTFARRGRADTDLPGAQVGAVLPGGELAAAVMRYNRVFGNSLEVVRLEPGGTRDAGFGEDGLATLRLEGLQSLLALAPQGSGLLVALGRSIPGSDQEVDVTLIRLDSAGRMDPSFGTGGVAGVRIAGYVEWADVAIRPAGGIVLATSPWRLDTGRGSYGLVLAAWHASGQPDAGFGSDGTGVVAGPDEVARARALAVAADGRLGLAGGTFRRNFDFAAWRFGAAGDAAWFGTADLARGDDARAVAFDRSGRMLLAGDTAYGLELDEPAGFGITRLDRAGRVDRSFGRRGRIVRRFREPGEVRAMTIQPDGRVLVAGWERRGRTRGPSWLEPGAIRLLRVWGGGRVSE